MKYTITTIEQAIVDAVSADDWITDNVRTIGRYAGQMDDLMTEMPSTSVPTPALYVLYQGSEFTEVAIRSFDENKRFAILAIVKDVREGQTLRDAANEIVENLKRVLAENDLGLDAGPITPIRIDPVMVKAGYCVYSFELRFRDIL